MEGSGSRSGGAAGREPKSASAKELLERLKLALGFVAELLLHAPPSPVPLEAEEELTEFYIYFLLGAAKAEAERQNSPGPLFHPDPERARS